MISFPNVVQHRIEPFRLLDESKPGHRKIVALFLVDPNIRIISTANVPAQRRDWWVEELWRNAALRGLSRELYDGVADNMNFPIGEEEAKTIREKLMDERKEFARERDGYFFAHTFALCEH